MPSTSDTIVNMKSESTRLREREKRYIKKYGVGMELYNELLAFQNHRCAVCGREADTFKQPLNIDHYHFKVTTIKTPDGWEATAVIPRAGLTAIVVREYAKTKTQAQDIVKKKALPLSIRGLLCPGRYKGCNRKLGRVDDPVWLTAAAKYLFFTPMQKLLAKVQ